MKTYQFTPKVTMKEYNRSKYWIYRDLLPQEIFTANNVHDALRQWQERVKNGCYLEITDTAIKNKSRMFTENNLGECFQCGYVITGITEIENKQQFVDIWVEIKVVGYPEEFSK